MYNNYLPFIKTQNHIHQTNYCENGEWELGMRIMNSYIYASDIINSKNKGLVDANGDTLL